MSRQTKLKILIPVIVALFLGAYARHKYQTHNYTISGTLQSKEAREISGIAASGISDSVYYVHNDSGDSSRFFAITANGKLLSTINYHWRYTDHSQLDCEDIAVGPGPVKGKSYIYIGDIGDNAANRKYVAIHRVTEQKDFANTKEIQAHDTPLYLKYPDGPKDAETLMIDPLERLIYIVTKRRDSVAVYTTPLTYKPNDTVTLTFRTRLYFEGIKPFKWITAGDISKDGQKVLLKSYQKVYYWQRKTGEPIWQTLQRKPEELPYLQEKLGEAIGFTANGKGYYTTSEGVYSPIYFYKTP